MLVRPQPMQNVVRGSITHTLMQGLVSAVRVSPIPNLSFRVAHTLNRFAGQDGSKLRPLSTQLFQSELRLAVSPRLQLAAILQYNSDLEILSGNARRLYRL